MILAVLLLSPLSYAQTNVLPGETVTLGPFDYSHCDTQTDLLEYTLSGDSFSLDVPTVHCDITGAASGNLKVRAGQGLLLSGSSGSNQIVLGDGEDPIRHGIAIGQIGKTIQIPALGVEQVGAEVLAAQISTEINWAGLLWNRRLFIPSWTQVVGTLQVRDLTTGLVVASNTFLNERVDLENNLPSNFGGVLDAFYGWTTVRNSSGVDLTAQLLRGRNYRIEVEVKCEDLSAIVLANFNLGGFSLNGLFAGGGCFFSDAAEDPLILFPHIPNFVDATIFNAEGGFQVNPLTVTVQDDTKAKLAEVLENLDSDGDGVINLNDGCPDSNLSPTIVIDGCDSGVENTLSENGCTISDEIAQCAAMAGNHGQFVSCVAHLTNDHDLLLSEGSALWADRGGIQRCAAQAAIP